MNRAQSQTQKLQRSVILIGAVAAMAITVGCSDDRKSSLPVVKSDGANIHPAVLQTSRSPKVEPVAMTITEKGASPEKTSPKAIAFNSRDYGVSFVYPWQYTTVRAKKLAEGDDSLLPKSDGSEDQFTLIRVEVPKGFYPDTDLYSSYFTLSLNQDIDEQQCQSVVIGDDKDKVQSENINGVDFKWSESNSGGRGGASRVRNYVTYQNGTCYEVEMGVKTKNERGLSKEVNTDQVFARLNGILKTINIQPEMKKPQELKNAAENVVPSESGK
jgi:hypothetical protein